MPRASLPSQPDRGAALFVAVLVTTLLSVIGLGLLLLTSTEVAAGANHRQAHDAIFVAEAALERAIDELVVMTDWTPVLQGARSSALVDGPPTGPRSLGDESTLDLAAVQSLANCGRAAPCSVTELNAVTADRPWGPDNPRWQLYAFGPPALFVPGASGVSSTYVVVLVADDPAESDANPLADSDFGRPGAGIIEVRAEAFGGGATHAVILATIARRAAGERARAVSWRLLR